MQVEEFNKRNRSAVVITVGSDETVVPGHCCLAAVTTTVALPLNVLTRATSVDAEIRGMCKN